jgi:F0F1-type ATP synthase membrane subunit b/b'
MKRLAITLVAGAALLAVPSAARAQDHGAPHAAPNASAFPHSGAKDTHGATTPDPHQAVGEHEHEHGAGEHHELPPLNVADFGPDGRGRPNPEGPGKPAIPPLVALFANFILMLAIYYFAGRKKVAQALKDHRASVAKEIEEAQAMLAAAEKRAEHYQAKAASLEVEKAAAEQALREVGSGEKERIVKEAEEKAARMQKDTAFLVEQEIKQIRQDLWRDTVDLAVATAEELLKKRITAADQERLAEDYLADLGTQGKRSTIAPPAKGA